MTSSRRLRAGRRALDDYDGLIFRVNVAAVIIRVAITNTATKPVSGIDRDYAPVCADLSQGWTLCARDNLCTQPAALELIGARLLPCS